jgi:hypothetical protein
MRKTLIAIVAVLALMIGASTAEAGTVRMTTCLNTGGFATTTPGPLQLSLAWATFTPHLTQRFLDYQSVTYTVNGVSTTTTTGALTGWTAITPTPRSDGSTVYATRYTSPVVANLAAGDSVTVSFVFSTTKKVFDDDKMTLPFGPGNLFAPISCTITAQ